MNWHSFPIRFSILSLLLLLPILGASQQASTNDQTGTSWSVRSSTTRSDQPLAAENHAGNVNLLGHLGGMAQAVVVQGGFAYAGIGPELAIIEVADPADLERVGWLVAAGEVMDIAIAGDFAYIAYQAENYSPSFWLSAAVGNTGLQVVDLSDPTAPVAMATLPLADCGSSPQVVVTGSDAYLAFTACDAFGGIITNYMGYLYRLDISDPVTPIVLASYQKYGTAEGLAVANDRVYSLFDDFSDDFSTISMKVFDVSSPSGLVESGSTPVAEEAQGIALSGDYAFLAAGIDGLQVVDISDPISPTAVLTHSVAGEANVVLIQGTMAYLGLGSAQILPVDVSDALNPVDGSAYSTTGQSLDIAITSEFLYTANGWNGLQVFQTDNPGNGGLLQLPFFIQDLAVRDSYGFAATVDGFWVIDISDLSMPVPVAYLETPRSVSIALVGDYAYLACPGDGLRIIDISNPLEPVEAAAYEHPVEITQLIWSGSHLFVAAETPGLSILDLSNPLAPSLIGSFTPSYGVNAVAIDDNYAYLAADNDNLAVIDVSDIANPQQVGIFDPPYNGPAYQQATSVSVKDGIAYLGVISPPPTPRAGYYDGTVFMINISNPQAPVELRVLPSGGYGWAPVKIELGLDRVYVAFEQEGLVVYDTTDPSSPARIGRYEPSEPVYSLSLSSDVIYLYNKSIFLLRYDESAYLANRAYLPMINKGP